MSAWIIAVIVLYLILCALLIVVVLLQQRTKGGIAGVFGGGGGGGGAEQLFGSSGVAPFMTKITAVMGAVFLAFCIFLVFISPNRKRVNTGGTNVAPETQQVQPTAPIPGLETEGETIEETQPAEQPTQVEGMLEGGVELPVGSSDSGGQ
jgi:preprotein translocase subunit SecG